MQCSHIETLSGFFLLISGIFKVETDIIGQYVESARLATEISKMADGAEAKAKLFVDTCIERGIISEYFKHARAEVTDIMFTLFDQERETKLYLRSVVRDARAEGVQQGIEQGIEKGIEQSIECSTLNSISNIMESLGLTAEQAMDALKIPTDDRAAYLAKL